MTTPPLLYPTDLSGFPGSPFGDPAVLAAGERIRDTCGWHIAPVVTETVTVDVSAAGMVALPTLRLVTVTAVRDVTDATPVTLTLTDWTWRSSGILRCLTWGRGHRTLEVDISHGYVTCPPSLLELAAQLARTTGSGGVLREQVGDVSVSYGSISGVGSSGIARYVLAGIS